MMDRLYELLMVLAGGVLSAVVGGAGWIVKLVVKHEHQLQAMQTTLARVDQRVEKLVDHLIEHKDGDDAKR